MLGIHLTFRFNDGIAGVAQAKSAHAAGAGDGEEGDRVHG